MLFNSIQFAIYFTVVTALYFFLPNRYRWLFLLACSYYFYMSWKPVYGLLLAASTLLDYTLGLLIGRAGNPGKRKRLLVISILANFGLLGYFKYLGFLSESVNETFKFLQVTYNLPAMDILLPIGISFYTFQSVSYTIDVYRGVKEPERHLGYFALYISFFPQLVAGPIERSAHLLPQFRREHHFEYKRVVDGIKLMMWGLFKKVVIADRLAVYVDQVYGNPGEYTGLPLILATYFFAFQLYCDFSGYSDMAIGAARVLGIDLMDNFKRPFFAKSISELWRRWHISLMNWFRDYIYIPLGGNKVSTAVWCFNIMLVFSISGLWHGAKWTFVLFGVINGVFVCLSTLTKKARLGMKKSLNINEAGLLSRLAQVVITFNLFAFSLVAFRSRSVGDMLYIMDNMTTGFSLNDMFIQGATKTDVFICIGTVTFLLAIQMVQRHTQMREFLDNKPLWLRWSVYYALLLAIMFLGVDSTNQFIYFQF